MTYFRRYHIIFFFVAFMEEPDFETSKLGTKDQQDYLQSLTFSWDSAYTRELTNFEEHGDVGEVW